MIPPVVSETSQRNALSSGPIVFFDGVCGLCNTFVDFALPRDHRGVLLFSPLQGRAAENLLSPADRQELASMVLLWKGRTYHRSEAVLKTLELLGGGWRILSVFARIFPLSVRNAVYRFVARHRYRFFGKRESCRLPTPGERARFVD